ncbi:MAG: hypothetical protein NT047_00795 [Deltaproteobacteria bacterium]|nr:hypothetical protein [Deltaproteobacteria bacterium]
MERKDQRTERLKKRAREIERTQDKLVKTSPDEQELAEREEAATAYAGENESHFVNYIQDCVKQSITAMDDIRRTQLECYDVYKENTPLSYMQKEPWQAQIIIPKPFATVQYGAAAVKKAFTPKFLSIRNPKNELAGRFWQKVMDDQLNEQHANFTIRFTDAVTMSLAIGVSMEMIPRFVPGRGLEYCLTEPWKIHRDPDSMSRDNQSGIYWIHQEYLDWYVLKEGEKAGRYRKVDRCVADSENAEDPFLTKEAIAERKKQIWQRSDFRKMVLTSEFWGTILDPKGNLLLPNARFTVAGGRVIGLPKVNKYPTLRWPGNAFSPLPDLLCFGGRGLLEGIRSVWKAMNDIMCLHQDYLMWIVNPMTEINIDALENPADVKTVPGKEYLTRDTPNGQQAVRTVQRRFVTNEILANLQYHDQNFQRGSLVTDSVQGLPGYRKDITYRESAQNLDQALGVYSLMGENIEAGAIAAISAGAEMIYHHAGYDDYARIFTEKELQEFGITRDINEPNGVKGVPPIDGAFHVSGMQALMRENEALANIRTLILPLLAQGNTIFSPFLKPYNILKAIEGRTNLRDEDIIVSEKEAKLIEAQQYEQLAKQAQAAAQTQEIADASQAADLMQKVDQIGTAAGTPPVATRTGGGTA